jgi:hypothetical protein
LYATVTFDGCAVGRTYRGPNGPVAVPVTAARATEMSAPAVSGALVVYDVPVRPVIGAPDCSPFV